MCNGDQLDLTCNITLGSTVEWSTFGIPEGGMTPVRYGRLFLNNGPNQAPVDLTVKSVLFNFSRLSTANALPLVTRPVISPVISGINGAEVICQDALTHNSSSTTIIVINGYFIPGTWANFIGMDVV